MPRKIQIDYPRNLNESGLSLNLYVTVDEEDKNLKAGRNCTLCSVHSI